MRLNKLKTITLAITLSIVMESFLSISLIASFKLIKISFAFTITPCLIPLDLTQDTANTFNLWPTKASTASNLVGATIIPVIDPVGNSYKNEYTTVDALSKALKVGNYVSAGNNQKLTMISADNVTLDSMQPGIIYLV